MTCGTAFWRTIIMRKESSTLARAIPSVERVSVVAICEIGVARAKANITRPIPISMVVGMLMRVSMSQRTNRRSIRRCSTQGMRITLSNTVIRAE